MPEACASIEALRVGADVADRDFDDVYPPEVRELSESHFTPVAVARQAARLLVAYPGTRILDLGAGAGKFCLVGALTTKGSFTGIERSGSLVETARQVAVLGRVPRVHFIHGDVADLEFGGYEGFYLFNPFVAWGQEGLGLSPARRIASIEIVRARLAASPRGTRVVTYHGFGGDMPATYRRVYIEECGTDVLELWIQHASRRFRHVDS
jgi:predicted RNA methylase